MKGERAWWLSWAVTGLLAALFLFLVFRSDWLESLAKPLLATKGVLVQRTPLYVLAAQHLVLAGTTSLLSLLAATGLGILASFPSAFELKALLIRLSSLAETFPSVAILALSVPFIGYGFKPTFLALVLYGILPVLRNTIVGIESVPPEVVEAARGMGMGRWQLLRRVELPLAFPVILAGVRVSVIINISAATMGATVGAGGFGVPIVSGLRAQDPVLILRGAVPVALLAVVADSAFRTLERWRAAKRYRASPR
jgi:osmoprotectant transport system permease protein